MGSSGARAWMVTVAATVLVTASTVTAGADQQTVGTTFPEGFPVIRDASLGVPVIGFGADGPRSRPPVILLHGNNDTPYPTECNGSFGNVQRFAQYLVDHGHAPSEVWALGYQGDQCDLLTDPPQRSGQAHATAANVADLRRFVAAVRAHTGAAQVDIVGHSLGGTLAREWMRQDRAHDLVRTLVTVDSPHHGIINCSPDPRNVWQQHALGGFTPDSRICREYGAGDTPFLRRLNEPDETPGPTRYVAIVNADVSFVHVDERDGLVPPVPAQNRRGEPEDFSDSARLDGATVIEVTGQGAHDDVLQAAHLGIVNSPEVWALTAEALALGSADGRHGLGSAGRGVRERDTVASSRAAPRRPATPSTGGLGLTMAVAAILVAAAVARVRVARRW